jgi:hypothetical protein
MKNVTSAVLVGAMIVLAFSVMSDAQEAKKVDKELEADLKLLQGSWEQFHGGKGRPTTRSTKTIVGNKETVQRFNIATGKKTHEHSVEFKLSKTGDVRVMTFYRVGGNPDQGMSYVYKVDEQNFWDIPGLLQGDEFRNYQNTPTIWHWKRVKNVDRAVAIAE